MLLLNLSTFFQSKLRRMTIGGVPELIFLPDRQGVVSVQHSPSAESKKKRKKREVKHFYKYALELHKKVLHSTAQAHTLVL